MQPLVWQGPTPLWLCNNGVIGLQVYLCPAAFRDNLLVDNKPEGSREQQGSGTKLICHRVMRDSHRKGAAAEVWLAIAVLQFCRLLDPDSFRMVFLEEKNITSFMCFISGWVFWAEAGAAREGDPGFAQAQWHSFKPLGWTGW